MTHPPTSRQRIAVELAGSLLIAGLALAFLVSLSGCQLITPQVITTEIERTEHGFRIVSPKDTTIKGLRLNGNGLEVDEYTAKASPEALAAGAAESQARAAAVGKLAEAAAALK